ncbi:MAG: hypothetical protein GC187_04220 [Alphaproteobacteria bacterium]|nr:hypothetical protein [Alphaproteobacteria bacterium]
MSRTLFSRTTALAGLAAAGLTFGLAAGTASAQSISVGQSINGELTGSDPRLSDGSHFDCYNLQTRTGERLQIDQTSGLFDSFLMVRRGGCSIPGDLIAHDDDGGPGLDSRLVLQGDGSVWAIIANSVAANATGAYQLQVTAAGSGQTQGAATPRTAYTSIAAGQSVNGELTGSDPRLSDGSHFDCYNLQTRAGEALQIDQTSGLFDSYLIVRQGGCDNPGAVIAEDDDGGGALNSRIVQQGDGALWAVIVNSLSANETGPYQLRVSAAGSGQAQSIPAQTAAAAQLPRVETEWGTQPEVCHAAYTAIVQLRAAGTAPEEYGNLRGMDYAARASRTGAGLTSDNRQLAETYTMNFRMMALVGALGFAPNGTPNGHRPLAEYLTVLGNCDRANGFAPVTAY